MHTVARQSRDDMKHILYPFSNCAKLGTQEHYLFLPRGRFRGHRREEHALRAIGVPSAGDPNSPGGTAGWVAMVGATWCCHRHELLIQPRRRIKHTRLLLHLPLPRLWPYWKHLHQAPKNSASWGSFGVNQVAWWWFIASCHLRSKIYSFQEWWFKDLLLHILWSSFLGCMQCYGSGWSECIGW